MNKTYFFRFVLLTLFLLAYQLNTTHSIKHLVKSDNNCHLCASGQQFDENLHEISFSIFLESYNIESAELEQEIVVKKCLDFTQNSLRKKTDLTGMQYFAIIPIPLGYLSTAPPTIFS